MKRVFLIAILVLALCLGTGLPFGQTVAAADLGNYSWTGDWSTNWGDMTLTQTGSKVTGTYTHDQGKISGTVSGNTLTGTWSEDPSYSPPSDAGEVEFVMSEDGKSFTGKWRYGSEGSWGVWEGGTRITEVISAEPPKDYGNASSWAVTELDKAAEYGLIPTILHGTDMTKPITREEFAALGVKLYEQATGTSATAASPNPFNDTNNIEILKAFKLGVTTGTSSTTFSPNVLINREQCAAMLFRTIKAIHPDGNYSIAGIADFPDQKNISSYAVEATKYMSKLSIVKGDSNGYFMPKATTSAQTAAGYGMATREAAVLMSIRTYDKVDEIKESKAPTTTSSVEWLIGSWGYSTSNGDVNMEIMYEFKADGTFYKVASTMSGGARTATDYKGKYRISGDKLILSDQLKGTGPASSRFDKIWYITMDSYDTKDVSAADVEYSITKTDDGMLNLDNTVYTRGR